MLAFVSLNSITWLQRPVISPMSLSLCRKRPAIALYVPEKKPCAKVSRSYERVGATVARAQLRTDLGLELQVAVDIVILVRGGACIAELKDHLAEEDSPGVHVRHRDHIVCMPELESHPPAE